MSDKFVAIKHQVKTENDLSPQTIEQRFDENDPQQRTAHDLKVQGGHDFQQKHVLSVCVFDETGFVWLYLRKNPVTGECIKRESR